MIVEEARGRYLKAAHAMQSGVAATPDKVDQSAESLRVGVNSALVNDSALATLLIGKGIITEDEYVAAVAEAMEQEVRRYEQELSATLGAEIHLS